MPRSKQQVVIKFQGSMTDEQRTLFIEALNAMQDAQVQEQQLSQKGATK